jgi:glycosyltransferase involved in cell wall biosynthesis
MRTGPLSLSVPTAPPGASPRLASTRMPEPTFSVVIPTYNRAALLPKTLASVFAQVYPRYEIIVVDNCSTDNTDQVLAPLIDAGKIRYVRHDRNYERARSRNTGMEHARGDYVTFLDSDDLMYPNNLADAARYLADNPSARLVHNLYELVDQDGRRLHRYKFPSLRDRLRDIMEGNFLSCIGAFIHREIFETYRFDTDPALTGSEDWLFWIRVVADHPVARIPRINSGIVHHGGRTVVQVDLPAVRRRLELVAAKIRQDPHLLAAYRPYLDRLAVGSLVYLATVANSASKHREALSILGEAWKVDPLVIIWERFLRVLRIAMFRVQKGT